MNTNLLKLAKLVMKFAETKVGDATWIHEGDLAVGVEVNYENAEGEMVAVADGEYIIDESKVTVENGKVAEIEAIEAPAKPAEEPVKEEFSKKMQFAEMSYNDIMRKIAEKVGDYAYVIDANDKSATVSVWSDEDGAEHIYRYAYVLDESGEVTLGEKVEVFPVFVSKEEQEKLQFAEEVEPQEKDEKDLRIEELEGLLKDRDAVIEELTAKVKELEDKAAQPVEEPVKLAAVAAEKKVANKALKYFE